jgi:hypothetical protein
MSSPLGVVDSQRVSGAGGITMASGTTIDTGTAALNAKVLDGAGKSNPTSGGRALRTVKSTGGALANSGLSAGSNISIDSLQMGGNMTSTALATVITALNLGQKKLTVNGNLQFASSGSFTTQISGTGAGQLGEVAVNGTLDLINATLNATLTGGSRR